MGKRTAFALLTAFYMLSAWGQDIEIKDFARNHTSLIARMNPVMDKAGEACALIRFAVRDTSFVIEPNMGVVKRENKPGEILLYVPQGTKRLTVRYPKMMPLRDYEIPELIESKVTYDAVLQVTNEAVTRQKANAGHQVYGGIGFNVISVMGPSLFLGFEMDHHMVEMGAVIGLGKTDDLYFYHKGNTLKAAWNYKAIRAQVRYGYEFQLTDFLGIIPQGGLSLNMFTGSDVKDESVKTDDFKNASSASLLIGTRMVLSVSDRVKLQVTPEYLMGLYKSDNCKLISENDNTFKSWTDGFSLNAGVIIFF